MYCKNCGAQIPDGEKTCPNCKFQMSSPSGKAKLRFLPSFILGLIGTLFGISGGFCMTICSSLYSSGTAAFILILGGSIVGLVGACKCLNNAIIGSILQIIAGIMIMICAYGITGSEISTILAMLLFLISGIIGLIYGIIKNKT